jgi:hypothetical protein
MSRWLMSKRFPAAWYEPCDFSPSDSRSAGYCPAQAGLIPRPLSQLKVSTMISHVSFNGLPANPNRCAETTFAVFFR